MTAAAGPIRGYVLIAFYDDQSIYTAYRWATESPFNRALLPGYVAEIARRDILTDPEATRIVNIANGFDPE